MGADLLGRQQRQQQFLRTALGEAGGSRNPVEVVAVTEALSSGLVLDDSLGLLDLIGLAARHRRPPPAPWTPPIDVRQLPLPRVALYEAWHRLRWPKVRPIRCAGATARDWATPRTAMPTRATAVTFGDTMSATAEVVRKMTTETARRTSCWYASPVRVAPMVTTSMMSLRRRDSTNVQRARRIAAKANGAA